MIDLQRYVLTTEIHGGVEAVIYNGHRRSDGAPVAVKLLRSEHPSPREIAKLKHEFSILSDLNVDGVVRAYGLERTARGDAALVMERLAGAPLSGVLRERRLDLKTALEISASIAGALAAVHDRHIIHKDLKPHNILVDLEARKVTLIDFGISTRLARETQRAQSPGSLEGTLAYISPEQTGRMNRVIDHRTDLYSLGVTMYELLTGALPFQSDDPMELVHSHIARTPAPPHALSPEVPPAVSAVVMKLLSKAAEERYQSAAGLKVDLDACLAELCATGQIAPFEPGLRDVSAELRIPQTLYGREAELDNLMEAWERARRGAASLFLVAGYAGVGKSALVSELQKTIARERGYFVSGKFDQQGRSVPYASVTQALRDLVRQILTEPARSLARWKERFERALGPNAPLLTDTIPELEIILGPQPPVASLGPAESQSRFSVAFHSFIRAMSAADHPLAVFLDDLQWADPASLKLLRRLLTDPESASILVMGAYRDNEVGPSHPLALALEELRAAGASLSEIRLTPLDSPTVRRLVADTLSCDAERARPLADVIFEKTHGNPFFVVQLLRALYEDERLTFDRRAGRWEWDLRRVREMASADNVVDLMADKIQRLAPATQRALKLAACIGHQFDLKTLSIIHERSPAETASDLWEALREGLVLPMDTEYRFVHEIDGDADAAPALGSFNVPYRFLHDRVQQAAYSLIEADRKQDVHLRIGRLLLAQGARSFRDEELFELVNHLNFGAALITDPEERAEVARLNLAAGKRARIAAAFEAAVGYLEAGAGLLDGAREPREGDPGPDEDLAFELCTALAECRYLAGDKARAEALFDSLLLRARSSLRGAGIYRLRMALRTIAGDFAGAIDAALLGLALLGVDLRGTAEEQGAALSLELAEVERNLAGRGVEELIDAPALTDPIQGAVLDILAGLSSSAYIQNPILFALGIVRQVNISLKYGNAALSPVAYASYAVLLAGVLGRYAESRSFGELAIRLHERQGSIERACEVNFIFALPLHYSDPARRVLDYLARAHEAGLATGDFLFLSYSSLHIVMLRLGLGDELSEVGDELERNLVHVQRTKDKLTLGVLSVARQMIASLMGETEGLSIMSGDGFDELAFPEAMDKAGLSYVACFYYVAKLQLLYLQGDYEGARAAAELAEHRVAVAAAAYFTTELSFYACLTLAALASADAPVDQEGLPSALVSHAEKLAAWAAHGPANYRHKHLLVQAEIARLAGSDVEAMRLYDEAIAAAEESGFLRSEALANERCAMFHAERGRPKVARAYLSDARGGYLRWGAVAKVEDLERKHPHLLARSVAAGSQRDLRPTFVVPSATTTTSRSLAPSLLDAATAVEAAQAIAGEILVDKVIHRLMQLVIETAGAQRGVLLLDRDGELLIEATVAVDPSEVRVGLGRPLSPIKESGEGDHDGGGEELAVTIVQYVARTREPVVLDDAVESRFACDPYVAARRPRSILCQAMTHQGRLTGVLYLENNAAGRAFTPARLTLCGLLSSQAAIAVENARFRARLEGMTDELRRANERLEEEVCERTKELRRTSERLERELAERARSEEEHAVLQEEVIRAQKARIEELSTPLIPINDRVMVMPLVGSMDASRAQQVLETALCGAQASRAEVVILDITGVKLVDAGVASSLISTASALRLLGTRVVLTGVGPRVAQALVAMNVDLGAIVTKGTLQGGIAYATALRR